MMLNVFIYFVLFVLLFPFFMSLLLFLLAFIIAYWEYVGETLMNALRKAVE